MARKHSRSTLRFVGVCWFMFRGRVLGTHRDQSEGELLVERTGVWRGVTEIYWSIRGGLFCQVSGGR